MNVNGAESIRGGIKMPVFATREEQSADLLARGLKGYEGKFAFSFRVSPWMFFEVKYGELDYLSQDPHFSTAASHYNPRRRDYDTCGQAQESILTKGTLAWRFYKKWDSNHTKVMTIEAYDEMAQDLETLKQAYPFIVGDGLSDQVNLERSLKKGR